MTDGTHAVHGSDLMKQAVGGLLFLAGVSGLLVAAPAHDLAGVFAAGSVELFGLRMWLGTLMSPVGDPGADGESDPAASEPWWVELLPAA